MMMTTHNYNKQQKLKVLEHYGGNPPKCVICGFNNADCLEIDHIDNKGAEHRKKLSGRQHKGGKVFYRWLIKNNFPKGYQVLCRNCNWLKYLKHLRSKRLPPTFIKCKICGKKKRILKSLLGKAKYCSQQCYWKSLKGKKMEKTTGKKHWTWKRTH